jgi:hypothetical protein
MKTIQRPARIAVLESLEIELANIKFASEVFGVAFDAFRFLVGMKPFVCGNPGGKVFVTVQAFRIQDFLFWIMTDVAVFDAGIFCVRF